MNITKVIQILNSAKPNEWKMRKDEKPKGPHIVKTNGGSVCVCADAWLEHIFGPDYLWYPLY